MGSIWETGVTLPEREPLGKDIQTDVCVIGGGMAGILTAYYLQQKGQDVVVLEAGRVGCGQTKNTTAKITAQHALRYGMLLEKIGPHAARQYAEANRQAIDQFEALIGELGIDCGFSRRPAYLYATQDAAPLQQELEAAKKLGFSAAFTQDTELPFPVAGALRFDNQAQFQPLAFLAAVADKLTVYERTMARAVHENRVETDGGTVTAKAVVMATHYPFINVPGYYFLRMHQERSYVLALQGAPVLHGMYLGVEPDGYSFREYDGLLLFGGSQHRTGENSAGGKYRALQDAASQYYPGARVAAQWPAQDCIPLDGIPYIGQYAEDTQSLYVATGFQKWGMTTSMVAAQLLSEELAGKRPPYADVFSPHRFHLAASAKALWADGKQSVKGLARGFLGLPRGLADDLPSGHGGIVEVEGQKVGVYKDDSGEVFVVSAQCPHLGCQLEWNPDERSWDCPCHGSRFDHTGQLLDNPAMEDLDRA